MKKYLVLFLVLCFCIISSACALDSNGDNNRSKYTLESVAGWWTKPEGYEGMTLIYTFFVDIESETVISYDDYGNVSAEYPCRYGESGFTIECGDAFGNVTFIFDDNTLLNEEGTIQYVRCEPLSSDSAPISIEELPGVWYKNGETDDGSEHLILEDNGYRTEQFSIESGNGSWSLLKANYNDSSYTGPALDFEEESGFPPETLWVLENGAILYDDFHGDFYIKDGIDTWQALCLKYGLIRDSWECEEDGNTIRLAFFGEIILSSESTTESIGKWKITDGTLYLEYVDGNAQECDAIDEMTVDYGGKSFTRREAW